MLSSFLLYFFFLNDPAPPEIYTLSLHDALPISGVRAVEHRDRVARRDLARRVLNRFPRCGARARARVAARRRDEVFGRRGDRKSTRLNSSHLVISYAVFCLKKKRRPHSSRCYRS